MKLTHIAYKHSLRVNFAERVKKIDFNFSAQLHRYTRFYHCGTQHARLSKNGGYDGKIKPRKKLHSLYNIAIMYEWVMYSVF